MLKRLWKYLLPLNDSWIDLRSSLLDPVNEPQLIACYQDIEINIVANKKELIFMVLNHSFCFRVQFELTFQYQVKSLKNKKAMEHNHIP